MLCAPVLLCASGLCALGLAFLLKSARLCAPACSHALRFCSPQELGRARLLPPPQPPSLNSPRFASSRSGLLLLCCSLRRCSPEAFARRFLLAPCSTLSATLCLWTPFCRRAGRHGRDALPILHSIDDREARQPQGRRRQVSTITGVLPSSLTRLLIWCCPC